MILVGKLVSSFPHYALTVGSIGNNTGFRAFGPADPMASGFFAKPLKL
jgi:hypothetical protein